MKIDIDELIEVLEADENAGFCLNCSTKHYNIEPDARNYECEDCGEFEVFGAQEILLMGKYV